MLKSNPNPIDSICIDGSKADVDCITESEAFGSSNATVDAYLAVIGEKSKVDSEFNTTLLLLPPPEPKTDLWKRWEAGEEGVIGGVDEDWERDEQLDGEVSGVS